MTLGLEVPLETPNAKWTQPVGLYINGEWVKGKDGKTFETINPSTEKPITSVHEATEKDVDIAVALLEKPSANGERSTPVNEARC